MLGQKSVSSVLVPSALNPSGLLLAVSAIPAPAPHLLHASDAVRLVSCMAIYTQPVGSTLHKINHLHSHGVKG